MPPLPWPNFSPPFSQLRTDSASRILNAGTLPLQRKAAALPLAMMLLIAAFAAVALTAGSPASAHRDEVHEETQQGQQGSMEAQLTVGSDTAMAGSSDMHEDRSQMSFIERLLDWFGRTHPFIVHFPIAFFPAALFTAIVGRRRPAFIKPVQFLVVTGGLLAPIAALFGWLNGGWSLTDTEAVMTLHRWLGTGIGLGGLVLGIWAWRQPEADRGIVMIVSLSVMTVAILAQGWLGGAMIHGIDHLNW